MNKVQKLKYLNYLWTGIFFFILLFIFNYLFYDKQITGKEVFVNVFSSFLFVVFMYFIDRYRLKKEAKKEEEIL